MKRKLSVLGHEINIEPKVNNNPDAIERALVNKCIELLNKYRDGKQNLESRIIENERWYKMRHWEVIRKKDVSDNDPEPVSAWLINVLANKHADAMDNFPEPIALPREQSDESEAKILSSILPVVLERNNFEETYSDAWWYKAKNGFSALGVFWNPAKENGLGDIDIKKIDALNIYWEPGITDIQKSGNLFIVDFKDDEILEAEYPQLKNKLSNKALIAPKEYIHDDNIDTTNKSAIIDWYYKELKNGKSILHFRKVIGDTIVFDTKTYVDANGNIPYAERGLYDHGKYPIPAFDVLYPYEDSPAGFGFIDIVKNAQMYIDKIDAIIAKNALMAGKKRWFYKDTGGINIEDYADFSKDFVKSSQSVNEDNLREIDVKPLPPYIIQHKLQKIEELKETSGNRDFSQGGVTGGVTAASAIAALQEAGSKLSRDMIKGSYRVFREICYMCIELIRQFYDEQRMFRITGENGKTEYVGYNNSNIAPQKLPPAIQGEEMQPGYKPSYRLPIFDIIVKSQKANPFSREAQNENMKALYGMGFFAPQNAEAALIALEGMQFEGIDKTKEMISKNQQMLMQLQQSQQMLGSLGKRVLQLTGGREDPLGLLSQQNEGGGPA